MSPHRADPAGARIFVLEDEPDIARLICASLSAPSARAAPDMAAIARTSSHSSAFFIISLLF